MDHARRARVVVSHAGVGSIMLALMAGRRPVVVPRIAALGEAVDDHQVPLARRLDAAGLVRLVEDPDDLAAAVSESGSREPMRTGEGTDLARELHAYLRGVVPLPAGGPNRGDLTPTGAAPTRLPPESRGPPAGASRAPSRAGAARTGSRRR